MLDLQSRSHRTGKRFNLPVSAVQSEHLSSVLFVDHFAGTLTCPGCQTERLHPSSMHIGGNSSSILSELGMVYTCLAPTVRSWAQDESISSYVGSDSLAHILIYASWAESNFIGSKPLRAECK